MKRKRGALSALVASLVASAVSCAAWAIEPFVVRDIRVEGVQRTEPGTIFSYLPIKVGDRVDDQRVSDAVKALYATGFFRDVRLEAQGDVLIVSVQERPTISSLTFVGNKEFDTDTIKKALKDIGIAEARIFDRSALDRAEQEMKRQYITRGYYAANIQTTVTPQERNRVAINFTVAEGEAAKIARINIVGNKAFTEKQLLSEITLTTPGWFTWYTKNDQYSKQKLSADLETLRSFYQNRGYLEFNVESTQVSISPDKEDIFITVNVTEGPRFTVGDVRIAGDLVVPADELQKLVQLKTGDVFSREKLQASAKDISTRLGAEGYAFANVNAVPEVDRNDAKASFTFYVDPGRRAYVRRINISGNSKTKDEVIRREFRQLEDAWYDGPRIERSKVRVRRLGYFDDVTVETPPVPGTADQIDVEVAVTEKSTGNLLAGVGYSSAEGIVLNASISQQNIFGSGNALSLGVNTSKYDRTYSVLFTQPYYTPDGVSRTIEAYQKSLDPTGLDISQYASSTLGTALGFGVPITETDTINFGGRYEHTRITLFSNSPPVYQQFVQDFGTSSNAYILTAGWSRDTRDDILYPTKGRLQSALLETGLPFGDLAYWKAQYTQSVYWPVWRDLVLMARADLGYGGGLTGKPLPFFKAFFAGGVNSVRGYDTASLGPKDEFGNALGGRRKIVGNFEAFYPILRGDKAVRASVFFDAGQIYENGRQSDAEAFRFSTGIGLAWSSPIGPLKFSYAIPINKKPGDHEQRFQFQAGAAF
ncbi:MAG TPA: outer membrane protein assembly factor BamA [Casimicrobiaceae bacterium]|jgi:outer membrane protein insertion porin family|nr:outer membrane protein assembly factor BamA [Casimicrobiaceae bacterium]